MVAKITGEKDTHEKERELSESKRAAQSEIIIIVVVVFQGQYLRFSSTVSPLPTLLSVLPLSTAASRQTSIFTNIFFSLSSVSHSAEEGSVPSPWSLPRMSQSCSWQLPYGFSNTQWIKWATNKQTNGPSVCVVWGATCQSAEKTS